MEAVKDEQEYIVVRERIHRDSELRVVLRRDRELIRRRSGGEHEQPRQVLEYRADRDVVCRLRMAGFLSQAVRFLPLSVFTVADELAHQVL